MLVLFQNNSKHRGNVTSGMLINTVIIDIIHGLSTYNYIYMGGVYVWGGQMVTFGTAKDDQLSFLSACITVLGVLHYGHCRLLLWPHLQSSCLTTAGLWHVHACDQGPWASFLWCFSQSVERSF